MRMKNILQLINSKEAQDGFYPTPKHIAEKMLEGVDFKHIKSILEPSAGKGDLCDAIVSTKDYQYWTRHSEDKEIIDCIEIDKNLQRILKGKGYRVVHDDFLTYETQMPYDLIVMNPPFSEGDKHLMKALSMVKDTGGQVICLLNAQTIENPYSITRQELIKELENADVCSVEKVSNAFSDAERQTDVEIYIVRVKYERRLKASKILEEMKKAMPIREPVRDAAGKIIKGDWRDAIVDHYNYEIACGLRLIDEYEGMTDMLQNSLKKDAYSSPMLKLTMGERNTDANRKEFVQRVRLKYWKALFDMPEFTKQLTGNLLDKFRSMVNDLKSYEFSVYNIVCIQLELSKEVNQGVADTIMKLFDDWTYKYHYSEGSDNVWYYNGWKTNDCFAVNQRVILPMYQCIDTGWDGKGFEIGYGVERKLNDIEKVFDYLNADTTDHYYSAGRRVARHIAENDTARNIQCKYFTVSLFKKGTCHIKFTNLDVLKKFNLFAAQGKNWLPPSYGKKQYKDMGQEEKAVIDSFEGEEEYNKVLANADYYLTQTDFTLRITG